MLKEYKCSGCGRLFKRQESQVFWNRQFCTSECYVKFQKKNSKKIAKTQNRLRNKKLVEVDGKCEHCGRSDVVLDIHHIDGSGDWTSWENSNNDLDNLQVLCRSCHAKHHQKVFRKANA